MRKFFTSPIFEGDDEKTAVARQINTMAWFVMALLTIYTLALPIVAPQLGYCLILAVPFYALQIGVLVWIRRGHVQLASVISFAGVWLLINVGAMASGGVRSPLFAGNVAIVVGIAAIFGRRWAFVTFGLSLGLGLVMVWAEEKGALPPMSATPMSALLFQAIILLAAAGTLHFATFSIGGALERARQELTERKRAESQREAALEALRATTSKLETLIQVSPLAITLLDLDGNIQLWNPSAERIFGWTAEEAIGLPNPTVPAAQQAEYAVWSNRVLHGQPLANQEAVRQRKNGSLADVSISSAPVYDAKGNLAGRMAIVADITERKRAEETHARLATAIEQAAESIVITDTAGTIQYVNPAFELITGYSPAEAIGQNPRILKSGKQNLAFYEALWATITAGQVWQGRLVNRRKDGSLYTEEATISPVRDESGAIVNYVAVKRDVTRELQLEEQYRQAQKMEAVGRLTAGVAHDFNNILTAINGFSELISLELAPDDPLQESVKKVLSSGQRAASLVRQLMAFSRKQIVQPTVLNLNEMLANVDKMLRRIIGEDVILRTIPAPGLWLTRADPVQVEQVILNLAVNARDAMPDGGKLTIETANFTLDAAYAAGHLEVQPGEYVLLAVSDTGLGMNEEVKSHLFEPFYTTKELGQGTGLGLATVYGIVKQSGGDIHVYSEEGVGTTFKVYLPRIGQATTPAARPPARPEMPAGRETILLVEDDEGARELARRVLRSLGYTSLEARDGQEALRLAADYPGTIHMLLTDVVLPGIGGRALAEQLARSYPGLKTLFMSGYTDNAIAHHGVLEPGIALLQKPFSPMELARKVREVLDA